MSTFELINQATFLTSNASVVITLVTCAAFFIAVYVTE